jgi:hypothetical protein
VAPLAGLDRHLISRLANYQGRGDTPSVTESLMRDGDVGVALSVLYQPFDEMDLSQEYGSPPPQSYFEDIRGQHRTVEDYVSAHAATSRSPIRRVSSTRSSAVASRFWSMLSRAAFSSVAIRPKCGAT